MALSAVNFSVVHGKKRSGAATNDAITASIDTDRFGRPIKTTGSGGTDVTSEGTEATLHYDADGGAQHARGLLTRIDRAGLVTKIDYPSANKIVETDERKVETTTELDEWLRPNHVFTSTPGLQADESATYDANGRVVEVKRKQSDARVVTESFEYDALGRMKKSKSDGVAVGDSLTTTESTANYDLAGRKITRTLPGGAVVTELLDGLGRTRTRITETGVGDLREEYAYDLAGNLVYSADNHLAQASAFDVHGRAIGTLSPDGTKTVSQYDAMGNPTLVQALDASGAVVSETKPSFTSAGRLTSLETKVDAAQSRKTETKWDGAGRSTFVATEGRASQQRFDRTGRLTNSIAGAGTLAGITTPFQSMTPTTFEGPLLTGASIAEKGTAPIVASYGYDTLANPTHQQIGSLSWNQRFDQDGNVEATKLPERLETTFEHDARGNVTAETKPGGATIRQGYAASGAPASYRDPVDEVTSTTNDRIGRPLVRTYVDGTTETFTYDAERLASTTDRQGRTFSYTYNEKGQLIELRAGGGELLETYGYEAAGRLEKWTTRDAQLRYENFDLEGRPRRTRQIHFADRSGFGAATILDDHTQDHEWNVHGERKAWTMALPAGFSVAGWTRRVEEEHDAAGNVISIQRVLTGSTTLTPLLTADYRGAGRPTVRTITTTGGAQIARHYGYDASTSQMNDLTVTARGLTVAGSGITYDGVQIANATLHGVSNETRANEYQYDERSRLAASTAARTNGTSAVAIEHVDPADFRTALERSDSGPAPLPSLAFAQQPGHKIAELVRNGATLTFSYGNGAEGIDDGRFVYEFDARGRLISATEKPPSQAASIRRIFYYYSSADRVVGRRAEYAVSPTAAWKLEDRAEILAADALPAEETFVWDPITDTLVTVAALSGEPLRQIIHGGNGYDDPI